MCTGSSDFGYKLVVAAIDADLHLLTVAPICFDEKVRADAWAFPSQPASYWVICVRKSQLELSTYLELATDGAALRTASLRMPGRVCWLQAFQRKHECQGL